MTHKKPRKSKIFTLLCSLTICLALMLGIAMASPMSTVYAEGATFEYIEIKGDTDVTSTDGTYTYTASNKTLILNNYNGGQFRLNDDATLVLQGDNFITVNENSRFHTEIVNKVIAATGVKADKNLTITGSGTLTINIDIPKSGENGEIIAGYGITSSGRNGNLAIKDNVKITINFNEGGSVSGVAILANKDLSIIENASVDITTVDDAIYSGQGKIIFSGTGEKKIKINRKVENWENIIVNAVHAQLEDVDISGTGKVLLDAVNGVKIRAIYAQSKSIKLHDNANVEINGFERGMMSSQGIDIKNSTVKIFSTLGNAYALGTSGNTILIQDSAVTVDVYSDFVRDYNNSLELQILGNSTVYVQSTNPAMCDNIGKNVRKHFALSEGGSITLRAFSYDYAKVWAELGEGTNLEVGKKLGQSETNPTWFEYEASQVYSYMTRFVYGDTSKASATMNDVTIKGLRGEAMPDTDVKLTLTGDTFKAIAKDADVTTWLKNMPKGLVAKAKADVAAGATEMTITVSGTPEEISGKIIWLEIPATAFTATNYGMTAEFNRNAKYEIISSILVDVPTPVSGLIYNGESQQGVPATEAYTVTNGWGQSAGTYLARLHLQYGFKWSDDTTEDKIVEWSIARKDVTAIIKLNETEYEYTGHEITPSFYVLIEESLYTLSASEYTVTLKNNKEVSENTASITVKDKEGGNYNITNTVTAYFSIVKPVRNAPEGLKGVAPTTDGGSDGKIAGTTADMEYSIDTAFTSPITCAAGETTGLGEGIYYVRYKATATTEPSHYATVKVMDNTVTVMDGAGEKVKKCKSGETVTIKVTVPTGKEFVKWSCTGISLPAAELEKEEITFTMPDNDVTLMAKLEDIIYNITVTNGTSSAPTAKYQEEVTVMANTPDVDEYFDKWEVTGLDTTGMDLTKTEIKFQMPAGNVTFKATYLRVTKYGIVIVDGTKDKEVAKAGETVTITANPAPTGKVFDKWTCETAGVTIEFASATSSTTTFEMPAREITIQAHFRDVDAPPSVEIKVEGGNGAGVYTQGESVTVTANEPAEGKVFKGWQDASGKIVSTEKSYTFTVNGETTLTAVYEDAPAAKKGLSGGAIAGIVIGSVLLAGIGGFAIFWFAVKKKSFGDLITAIKGINKKKQ
ncbi:MAG: hypothetical protein SOY80_01350 [Bacilli bacterium]|nr:hypothetical protein [Bacilli bacterium]